MKKTLLGALVLGCAAAHADSRNMEPVMQISADQTAWLLEDETVMIVSAKEASKLLGDENNLTLHHLNNMPATAAGPDTILYISPESAEGLLGDNP